MVEEESDDRSSPDFGMRTVNSDAISDPIHMEKSTQPTSRNPLGSALSGGLTGAGIGNLIAPKGEGSSALWPLLGGALGLFS